jgi:hypothetical protein
VGVLFGGTDYFIILNTMSMPAFQSYSILYDGSEFFSEKVALKFGGFNFYSYLCKGNKTKEH